MIYFDNSATTLIKPPSVARAVAHAIGSFGNAGRSFYDASMRASREIYKTREEIAGLIGLDDPLSVAFTSSATESLNLIIAGLIKDGDSVLATVTEHNSLLRPLHLSRCKLSIVDCDQNGRLLHDSFMELVKLKPRYFLCSHGSNVTGNLVDAAELYDICRSMGITMILDISQTFGLVPVHKDTADIFCFTGHKGLYGPQGTGGIIVKGDYNFAPVKTGGTGSASFDRVHSLKMPDIFEVGTPNSHGIYGLQQGVRFVRETGVSEIHRKESRLTRMFYEGIRKHGKIKIYGDFTTADRLPIVTINIDGMDASALAEILWEKYRIAIRSGSHCAPLIHRKLATEDRGMARFSFSFFNTEAEIEEGLRAVDSIIKSLG